MNNLLIKNESFWIIVFFNRDLSRATTLLRNYHPPLNKIVVVIKNIYKKN